MPITTTKKRNIENFEFTKGTSKQLRWLKRFSGMTKKAIVERLISVTRNEPSILYAAQFDPKKGGAS